MAEQQPSPLPDDSVAIWFAEHSSQSLHMRRCMTDATKLDCGSAQRAARMVGTFTGSVNLQSVMICGKQMGSTISYFQRGSGTILVTIDETHAHIHIDIPTSYNWRAATNTFRRLDAVVQACGGRLGDVVLSSDHISVKTETPVCVEHLESKLDAWATTRSGGKKDESMLTIDWEWQMECAICYTHTPSMVVFHLTKTGSYHVACPACASSWRKYSDQCPFCRANVCSSPLSPSDLVE